MQRDHESSAYPRPRSFFTTCQAGGAVMTGLKCTVVLAAAAHGSPTVSRASRKSATRACHIVMVVWTRHFSSRFDRIEANRHYKSRYRTTVASSGIAHSSVAAPVDCRYAQRTPGHRPVVHAPQPDRIADCSTAHRRRPLILPAQALRIYRCRVSPRIWHARAAIMWNICRSCAAATDGGKPHLYILRPEPPQRRDSNAPTSGESSEGFISR